MPSIVAICISEKRGTQKYPVQSGDIVEKWGIKGDAHGGNWHRQVSLISLEKINAFKAKGADIDFGAFGENIVAEGIDFSALEVGTRFVINDVVLELTQIGKECHSHCNIYQKMGDCIMPREGVFAKVIKGGSISVGDSINVVYTDAKRAYTAAVITLSDKGYSGEREDKSGPLACEILTSKGYNVVHSEILPDDRDMLEKSLINLSDRRQVNLVITTGGTGFSKRDITPEATLAVCERRVPGISEAIRAYSMTITKRAMLSRGESVIRGNTLIVNLPGSPKAVDESLNYIVDEFSHGLGILCSRESECGR